MKNRQKRFSGICLHFHEVSQRTNYKFELLTPSYFGVGNIKNVQFYFRKTCANFLTSAAATDH